MSPISPTSSTFVKDWSTVPLAKSDLFKFNPREVLLLERVEIAHARAKAIGLCFNPSIQDILHCTEKFWEMHIDPINAIDGSAVALWTLQCNLFGGTLAPYVLERPEEFGALWEKAMKWEVTGHYMLSEVGHGLDAANIETVARWTGEGFVLDTPNDGAAKCMPASIPAGSIPRIAIVMARLKISDKDFGPRPFLVAMNDGKEMCEGITARLLPNRSGSRPIGHAITHFKNVQLPSSALLDDFPLASPSPSSSSSKNPKPKKLSPRLTFLTSIWRIGVGSTTLTSVIIPALRVHAYIVSTYSSKRIITTPTGAKQPIIAFRTQQRPILGSLACAWVLEKFFRSIRKYYTSAWAWDVKGEGVEGEGGRVSGLDVRNGVSTAFKVVAVGLWREMNMGLMDRIGSQGLFEYNQIIAGDMEVRGVTVAEGDIQVLSIRLAAEVLLGRYQMPQPQAEDAEESLLRRHELGLMEELSEVAGNIFTSVKGDGHRNEEFDKRVLPRALDLVEAIGMRMAYDAAKEDLLSSSSASPEEKNIKKLFLDLFEAIAVKRDMSWYTSNSTSPLTREGIYTMEDRAMRGLMDPPVWKKMMGELEESVGPYVYAAIGDEGRWKAFYDGLEVFKGGVEAEKVLGKL